MRKSCFTIPLLTAFLSFYSVSHATSFYPTVPPVSLPCGVYLDGNYGFTKMYGKSYPGSAATYTGGKGWSGDLGYKFMPYFAAESGYTRYMDTRIQNAQGITAARDRHYSVYVAGKGILPVYNSGIELFAKAGLAWIHSKIGAIDSAAATGMTLDTGTETSTGLYWGGGIQYYFSENVSANIQYAQAQGNSNTGTLGVATVGLSVLL